MEITLSEFLLSSRIPITPRTTLYQFLLYTPCLYLAYLARREDTYTLRLLVLPIVLSCTLFSAWGFTWTGVMVIHNWGHCSFAGILIAKSLEHALTREGMLKIGEVRPGIMKEQLEPPLSSIPNCKTNGTVNGDYEPSNSGKWKRLQGVIDALELLLSFRGLNFQFGIGTPIPPHHRPLHRPDFLLAALYSFLTHFMILDILESTLKLFPGVGSPSGGSMYNVLDFLFPHVALPLRLLVALSIHIMTGAALLSGFKMVNSLITLIFVGICNSSPENWPPVIGDPWRSDSMHRFWARDWHQLLRRTLFVFGGYPVRSILSRLLSPPNSPSRSSSIDEFSLLFGTFLASGLWHECSMYALGRGFDWIPVLFFASQTLILLLERAWRRITGRRVGGLWGKIWVYFVIFVLAQGMVDSWHRRGLAGGLVIPHSLSPMRVVFIPLARKAFSGVDSI